MDWEAISAAVIDRWNSEQIRPPKPGVYRVLVKDVQRFARWTGSYWTNWAMTARWAERCEWRGPSDGYRWKPV